MTTANRTASPGQVLRRTLGVAIVLLGLAVLGRQLWQRMATDPVVLEAVDRIAAAARAAGLHAGMHCTSAEYAREMIARGFDFVTVISDETLLSRGRAERAKLP